MQISQLYYLIRLYQMESIIQESKIHFYEFMEIELLNEYIFTGIQYMVKSILNSNQKLIPLRYYYDQIATLISGIKDAYFLIKNKGIYAENFYGLERVNKRSRIIIVLQLLLWIVLPYLFRKLQNKFNQLKQKLEGQMRLGLIQKIYMKVFPIMYCLVKIVSTVYKFRYLIVQQSKYYNPDYCIAKTQLGYLERQQPSPFPIMTFLKSPGLFLILVAHKIVSSFFASKKKQKSQAQIVQIQAPIQQKKVKQCPICGKKFKNPAVLRSSGYVFCYSCINQQVRKQRKCPVTGIESDQTQIQIIYQ